MNRPEKTQQRWSNIGFEVEITGDGSPSLRLLKPVFLDAEKGESMHHSGGAAAETELIYGQVLKRCFQEILAPHFLSVGLGLGYVELVTAREALLKKNFQFSMESFELVPELKQWFISWLQGQSLSTEVQDVYDSVLKFVLQSTPEVKPLELKALLCEKLENKDWNLQGPLTGAFQLLAPSHGLLFDAFSAKTTPEIWTEDFLVDFFTQATAADAMVATYACRGSLKRALMRAGFEIEVRPGFQGKRNSTRAYKGVFKPISAPAEIF